MTHLVEYIWIDGGSPTPKLRSKTKVVHSSKVPEWGFDGSSTDQAQGSSSDCILIPVRIVRDPLRGRDDLIALCEVYNADRTPSKTNHRNETEVLWRHTDEEPLFGIEQEYTMFKGREPLGWPKGGYPAPQGPFYCGVGADEVYGREIVEKHMRACLDARLLLSGVNAEVMPGQWEFQIGPGDPLRVSDHLWLARYLLYRIAEEYGVTIRLDPKPVGGDWNGAGAHTNFSTKAMREDGGIKHCLEAAEKLGERFDRDGFPEVYGAGFRDRLTGAHETCSYREFKYGVADRTASVRVPLAVAKSGKGYIEDRRPCANVDPYEVCSYVMEVTCGSNEEGIS